MWHEAKSVGLHPAGLSDDAEAEFWPAAAFVVLVIYYKKTREKKKEQTNGCANKYSLSS